MAVEGQKLQYDNLKAFLARNHVNAGVGSTETSVKAAINSQLLLSESLEKDGLSTDRAHIPASNAFDMDKEQVNIRIREKKFADQRLNNTSEPHSFHEQLKRITKLPQTKEEYKDLKRN